VTDAAAAKRRTAATYDAAADTFDDPALAFWDRFGRRTVERLVLAPGAHVLDVCCGAGASAIPAAEAVGPTGHVVGVDLAGRLVDLARAKAARRGLSNLELRIADMEALGFPAGAFDAVVCVFGIFFVPDMAYALRELWRLTAPGGRLAVTTWGPRLFAPADGAFWDAVGAERPDLRRAFAPWERLSTPADVVALFADAGAAAPVAVAEAGTHALRSADDWWRIAMGSGYRATIDALDAGVRARLREANLGVLRAADVRAIETNVVYAIAAKR